MLITKKMLLALTLAGALIGAGIGALATHSANSAGNDSAKAANTSYDTTQTAQTANQPDKTPDQLAADNSSQYKTPEEQAAYRQGFNDGYTTADNARTGTSSRTVASYRGPARRYYNGRRVYYDYSNQPRGRTFWQKHRDKLTVAMGTGAGAILGGVIGGKKGAGIGALAGAGGSALYTYKLRHRRHRY
jgi:uncharacterized protein YcfJ